MPVRLGFRDGAVEKVSFVVGDHWSFDTCLQPSRPDLTVESLMIELLQVLEKRLVGGRCGS